MPRAPGAAKLLRARSSMDNPRKCVIYFEDRLSEEQVEDRIRAIRIIDGVSHVSTDQTSTKVPRREPEVVFETEQDMRPQRLAIDRALIWGIRAGKITKDTIAQANGEQIVALAMRLLDAMPEAEKEALSRDMSNLG